jgi:hypothetical protein
MLRSERSERLEAWRRVQNVPPSFETRFALLRKRIGVRGASGN